MAVKVTTTPTFTHGPPVSLFDAVADNYAVTRDGRRFCSQFQLERSTYLRR
jgi:hypothetical protein